MADRTAGSSTTWLTCDEVAFVRALGTHGERGLKTSRLTWLQRYLAVAAIRIEWGEIDKVAVLKEAKRLLRAEQRKANREKAA